MAFREDILAAAAGTEDRRTGSSAEDNRAAVLGNLEAVERNNLAGRAQRLAGPSSARRPGDNVRAAAGAARGGCDPDRSRGSSSRGEEGSRNRSHSRPSLSLSLFSSFSAGLGFVKVQPL